MMTDTPVVATLVGLGPGPTTGLRLSLARNHQLVGRSAGCDITLAEVQVALQHAVLTRRDGRTWVQDLGTPGGTFVNGQRLGAAPHPLRRGDVVVFGTVALRLAAEAGSTGAGSIGAGGVEPEARAERGRGSRPDQRRSARQREALLREIEASRVRARRLLGCGAAAFGLGFVLFTAGVLGLMPEPGHDGVGHPLGRIVFGVPYGLVGWGISAVGMVALIAGFTLHSQASTRRRLVERELPWRRSVG